jgi:Cdc6-like AAA superfamily ATPase
VINPYIFLEDVLIPHKAFQVATDRLEMFFQSTQVMREPICFALLGPSGSGKSRVLETVYQRHQPSRGRDGLNIPIIRVSVPSKPTIKGLGDLILKEIDKNDDRQATENQLTRRIQVLMRNCGTVILMLDEFQHFYDKHSHVVWHHVADWLKVLVDGVRRCWTSSVFSCD